MRITDSSNFPVSTIAAALVEVDPGGMRELHWHPNTDEWQYYIEGQARMGVFGASGQARTFDFRAGDVGFAPFAMGHYVENSLQEQLLRRCVARSMDGFDAAGAGALEGGSAGDGHTAQDQSARRAGVNHCGAAATRIENVVLRCM